MNDIGWTDTVASRWFLFGRTVALLALGVLFSAASDARAAEASSPLAGHWQLAETADEKKQRRQAIDKATRRLDGFRRSIARNRLSERTAPPPSLVLEIVGSKVTIAARGNQLELELGGPPIEVSGSEGKARMSATMNGPELIVEIHSGRSRRTTVYSPDGTHLSVEVTMANSQLAGPLKFASTYARVE